MSRSNAAGAKVKALRPLARRRSQRYEQGRLVIESAVVLGVALDAGVEIERVIVELDRCSSADSDVVRRASRAGAEALDVHNGTLAKLVDTKSPQPVAAIAVMPQMDLAAALDDATFVVVALDVADPGNLGTIIRSAEAAGADALILAGDCVDPWSPKVIRSSAGGVFLLPIAAGDTDEILDELGQRGLQRLAADSEGGSAHDLTDLTGPVALIVGNEAHGLPFDIDRLIDDRIHIPTAGRAESLNVAMAASILVFETARQRRQMSRQGSANPEHLDATL
ncbi:MAG: TrmH family RNA methyltransferase [Acidimicrobiales bacterium]